MPQDPGGFHGHLYHADPHNRPGTGAEPSSTITDWETRAQADGLREALGDVIAPFQALGVELETAQVQEVLTHA